jgi:prevent-host-death family protein
MTPKTIGAFDAKTHLSELLQQVRLGQVYVITRRGKPVAELRPMAPGKRHSVLGLYRGRMKVAPDFKAPLEGFEGYQP